MKANTPTLLWCVPIDPDFTWYVQANSRDDAEVFYMQLILQGRVRRPVYRIVCQFKVEQHDQRPDQISFAIH